MDKANPSCPGQFTPAIAQHDLEYYGEHWPHNSTVGMGYSTAINGFTAALGSHHHRLPPRALRPPRRPRGCGAEPGCRQHRCSGRGEPIESGRPGGRTGASLGHQRRDRTDQLIARPFAGGSVGRDPAGIANLAGANAGASGLQQRAPVADGGLRRDVHLGVGAAGRRNGLSRRTTRLQCRGCRRYGRRGGRCNGRDGSCVRRGFDQLYAADQYVRAGERRPANGSANCGRDTWSAHVDGRHGRHADGAARGSRQQRGIHQQAAVAHARIVVAGEPVEDE